MSAASTAAHIPSHRYLLPIKRGNVLVGTFLRLTEATGSPLSGPMTLRFVDLRRERRPQRHVPDIEYGRSHPAHVVRVG
jgi:hypothetical protein